MVRYDHGDYHEGSNVDHVVHHEFFAKKKESGNKKAHMVAIMHTTSFSLCSSFFEKIGKKAKSKTRRFTNENSKVSKTFELFVENSFECSMVRKPKPLNYLWKTHRVLHGASRKSWCWHGGHDDAPCKFFQKLNCVGFSFQNLWINVLLLVLHGALLWDLRRSRRWRWNSWERPVENFSWIHDKSHDSDDNSHEN